MAKRVVIDLTESPPLTDKQQERFIEAIKFAVDGWLDIHEYTLKVETEK